MHLYINHYHRYSSQTFETV